MPDEPDNLVYHVTYAYDDAGRLQYVNEPLLDATDNSINTDFSYWPILRELLLEKLENKE